MTTRTLLPTSWIPTQRSGTRASLELSWEVLSPASGSGSGASLVNSRSADQNMFFFICTARNTISANNSLTALGPSMK